MSFLPVQRMGTLDHADPMLEQANGRCTRGGRLAQVTSGNCAMDVDRASADIGAEDFWITEQTPRPGVRMLTVHGEADLHTAPELRERLGSAIDEGAQRIVLDLTETTFLDSMSLGVLLGAMKRMRARQGALRLVVSRPDVRRIFEITLLDRVFPIDDTPSSALDAIEQTSVDDVEGGVDAGDRVHRRDLENAPDARVGRDD